MLRDGEIDTERVVDNERRDCVCEREREREKE